MIHIYVDGSCLGNQNVDKDTPAGWGVVVITNSNDLGRGNGEISHEFNGIVITDSEHSNFIGAEVGSNNTAELTAFAEALRWILIEGFDDEIIIKTGQHSERYFEAIIDMRIRSNLPSSLR